MSEGIAIDHIKMIKYGNSYAIPLTFKFRDWGIKNVGINMYASAGQVLLVIPDYTELSDELIEEISLLIQNIKLLRDNNRKNTKKAKIILRRKT